MAQHTCSYGNHLGGLLSVRLYDAGLFTLQSSDSEAGGQAAPTAEPLEVAFADNGARYTERYLSGGEVEHRLEIVVSGFRPEEIARMVAMSGRGMVAILTLASGQEWVVGYSPKGRGDYPLRLLEAECDSSSKRAHPPTTRLLLGSVDGWMATPLGGGAE